MVLARQAIEGEGLLDRLFDPIDQPGIAARPFGDPSGKVLARLFDRAAVVEPPELLQAVVVGLAWQVVERVPQEVDVAALEGSFGEHFANRPAQTGMVIGDDQLDAVQAALAQAEQQVLPGGAAFAIGHLDGEDLAPAVPVDADRDQHRLADHDAALAHLLVAGIDDEIGKGLIKPPAGKGGQARIEPLVDRRDRRGRAGMAAQLLGDRFYLPGRDTLDVHLGQRRDQRLLGALVAFEQFGREAALPVLRHPQLELADPGHQSAGVVARAIAQTIRRALTLAGAKRLVHLGFQHRLHHAADDLAQTIAVLGQKLLDSGNGRLSFTLGHGRAPLELVTSNITSLPWPPISSNDFAEHPAHYRYLSLIFRKIPPPIPPRN